MIQIKKFMPQSHKIKALIYGKSGCGKTSFGGTAKNVIFASAENGLLSIADKQVPYVEIKTLDDLMELRNYLKSGKHGFETLVIDSITEISDIIKNGIEKKTGRRMQLQDWGELASKIEGIIKDIKEIDINVLVLAQELNVEDEGKIARIVPSLNGKSSTKICYYMDIVGYLEVDKNGNREIITGPNEKYVTKDRTGRIGNDSELDFEKWKKLVSELVIGQEKILEDVAGENDKKAENQRINFNNYYEKILNCKGIDCLKKIFLEITSAKNKQEITGEQYKELCQKKDDMKKDLENNK